MHNHFKVAFRNLGKNRVTSLVNILGLAIGMTGAVLIFEWVHNELSYDRFHVHTDELYKVWNRTAASVKGQINCWPAMAPPVGPALQQQYPEVAAASRYDGPNEQALTYADKNIVIRTSAVDKSFLTMFSFPLVKGSSLHALDEVNSLVLTESLAKAIFGADDPMGKLVRLNNKETYTVSGVLKNLPANTEFDFDCLIPLTGFAASDPAAWADHQFFTYVQLKPGVSVGPFNQKIRNLVLEHAPRSQVEIFLQPSRQWHLYPGFDNGEPVKGPVQTIRLLSVIACLILLIACINFMNLATAQSERRAKEVGVRKVIGATRSALIRQFLSESMLIAGMSSGVAVILIQLCLPGFNELVGQQLTIEYDSPVFWIAALGFVCGTGLVAGSYPAFYLSSFRPVRVLKGFFKDHPPLVTPRKLLVVVQFTLAIVLVASTLIMYQQVRYVQQRDNGYIRNNLVEHRIKGAIEKNYELIKNELLSSGAAVSVCQTGLPITMDNGSDNGFQWGDANPNQKIIQFSEFATTGNFIKTMGIHLLAGRDIDLIGHPTDSASILINETALATMGLKDPVGQTVKSGSQRYTIVGVIKDFINGSPDQRVEPMIVFGSRTWHHNIAFRLNGQNTVSADLAMAADIFKKYNPGYPFEYKFADEQYNEKFGDETRAVRLAGIFAGLTIFISCLGLFGLAAFLAENRSKEIGIRKTLGASVSSVVRLLTKEFAGLVTLAFLIATPISWWAMNKWLADSSYRIDIHWWTLVLAGFLAMMIAVLTVSFHAIKAALANPVDSLRTE